MAAARYLVAKYVPDLVRDEPRNIGVIVWTPETVAARFLAEIPGSTGNVDGRRIPSFVTSPSAYKQWIRYWQAQLGKSIIEPVTGGAPVSRNSPEYLDMLTGTSNGNFLLSDGGFLLDEVDLDEMPDVLDYLFSLLVQSESAPEQVTTDTDQPFLKDMCISLLKKSGLYTNKRLYRPYPVICPSVGSRRPEKYNFSFAYNNGRDLNLYHRVALPLKAPGELQKSVYSSNWMFHSVIQAAITTRQESGVILYADSELMANDEVAAALDSLDSVTRVFNLYSDENALVQEWARLAV